MQFRGALRRELTRCLRTGRALRQPGRKAGQRKNRVPRHGQHRPAPTGGRRPPGCPGHWEGDLLIGKGNATAIATLVERATGYAMLVALPEGYKPGQVAPARAAKVKNAARVAAVLADLGPGSGDARLEAGPRRRRHRVYFCDPTHHGNEDRTRTPTACCASTSPRAPDFGGVSESELDAVAHELNDRPRKRLGFYKPTEKVANLLLQ